MVKYTKNMLDLTENFGSPCGTDAYYKYALSKHIVYTSGIDDLCRTRRCYWLIDSIASYQTEKKFQKAVYQYWRLAVKDGEATLYCHRGDGREIHSHDIPYTDLPDGNILISAVWNEGPVLIIALPIEG